MSEAIVEQIHCSECLHEIPSTAEFCPYCGQPARAPRGARDPERDSTTGAFEEEPSVDRFRRDRRIAAGIFVGFLLGGALLGWLTFGDPLAETSEASRRAVRAASAAGETRLEDAVHRAQDRVQPTSTAVGTFSYRMGRDDQIDHRTSVLRYRGEQVLRLYTPKQSSHETLESRTRAAMVRVEWGAKRYLQARNNSNSSEIDVRDRGHHAEVVWTNGEESYRLLRISPADVRHWNQRPGTRVTREELARTIARDLEALYDRIARYETGVRGTQSS